MTYVFYTKQSYLIDNTSNTFTWHVDAKNFRKALHKHIVSAEGMLKRTPRILQMEIIKSCKVDAVGMHDKIYKLNLL